MKTHNVFLGRKEEMYIKENILGQKFSEMFLGFLVLYGT